MVPELVDTHAHAFLRRLPMVPTRRYTPAYDAPVDRYLDILDHHGVAWGVLVQPSFYGADNSYLVESLHAAAGRLRAIAVVKPADSDETFDRLQAAGVMGVRFNLIGAGATVLSAPDHRALIRRVAERGWQVHVQARGPDWPAVLTALKQVDCPVIADHYGLPDPALGVDCPGFQALLTEGPQGRLFVKLSAPYRCGGGPVECYRAALLERLGPERLLWGSDWPWTQHEDGRAYAETLADAAPLAATARRLFGFSSAAG